MNNFKFLIILWTDNDGLISQESTCSSIRWKDESTYNIAQRDLRWLLHTSSVIDMIYTGIISIPNASVIFDIDPICVVTIKLVRGLNKICVSKGNMTRDNPWGK